jgi:COP9 signalosome complex subunit 7
MNDPLNRAALAKLERFLLMAKSAKGAGAAKLIQDAISAPDVFVFAELLHMPNISEVRPSWNRSAR